MKRQTKFWAVLVLGLAGLVVLKDSGPVSTLTAPARRFIQYYKALSDSSVAIGPWHRLLFSLAMASSTPPASSSPGSGANRRPHHRVVPTAIF